MDNREQSVEKLFAAALNLPVERRAAFLDEACRGLPVVRQQVEEMLEKNVRLGSFLNESASRERERIRPGAILRPR